MLSIYNNLEGLKDLSKQAEHSELSQSQNDYLRELVVPEQEWDKMSLELRLEQIEHIQNRIEEVSLRTGISRNEIMSMDIFNPTTIYCDQIASALKEWKDMEGLNSAENRFDSMELSTCQKDYLKELDLSKQEWACLNTKEKNIHIDTLLSRVDEITEVSDLNKSNVCKNIFSQDILDAIEHREYQNIKPYLLGDLLFEDYHDIKELANSENLEVADNRGCIVCVNCDGKEIVELDLVRGIGEALIGEYHYKGEPLLTGLDRGEFRLPNYDIEDIYNVFGPNARLTGDIKQVTLKNGAVYDVPIIETSEVYHGMRVKQYGTPDFSQYAVDTIEINPNAVVREASSHKVEATKILAENYMNGKYPEGTFTAQQQIELKEVANGCRKETISGLTPHHLGNAKIQFVNTSIHERVNHMGASWLMNEKKYFQKT